jgi:hypothetical protein
MEKILKLIKDLTWYNKVEKSKEILRLLTTIFLQDAPEDGNIYGRKDGEWEEVTASTSTPTLLEVTNVGNEIETDINVKSILFKIGDLDEDNFGTGIEINNDESSINFFRNLENFMNFNRDAFGGTNSLGGVWGLDFTEIEGAVSLRFPNKTPGNYAIATIDDVISSNTTATNGTKYLAVANLTMTDITPPSEGAFYEVTVINGTATIGGVGYTVGQKVFRHYHSGSWRTFVYGSSSTAQTASNFANDTEAASGGVQIGQLYHTAGVVKIRLS